MQNDNMTKQEFLYALKRALSGEVSPEVFNENMNFYEEYISTEIQKGQSEEEVMEKLGDPRLIAKTIIETSSPMARSSYAEADYDSDTGRENKRTYSYGFGKEKNGRNNMHIFSGWKAALILFTILAVIILFLVLIFKAIGALFYFFGPVFMIVVLILLLRLKD